MYWFLKTFFPRSAGDGGRKVGQSADYVERLKRLLTGGSFASWTGKTIVDFGCGSGQGVIALAQQGVEGLVGYDIRPTVIDDARKFAAQAEVSEQCRFIDSLDEVPPADVIVSIDAFEHFSDPASVLETMAKMLAPGGQVLASFGPTWFHPRGGHLFSVFPWAHLVLSEASLCRWRRDFRDDGATTFEAVEGGLNRMTIRQFERLVDTSPLRVSRWNLVPIRPLRWGHCKLTREFTTAIVECVLEKR